MRVTYVNAPGAAQDLLICPVFEGAKLNDINDSKIGKIFEDMKKKGLFTGESGEAKLVYGPGKDMPKRILLLGLGKKNKASDSSVRNCFAKAVKGYQTKEIKIVGILKNKDSGQYVQSFAEAVMLVNYNPAQYKTGKDMEKSKEKLFTEIVFVGKNVSQEDKKIIKKSQSISESVHLVRNLVNGAPNHVTVDEFANEAKKIAKKSGFSIKVYDKDWIAKKGMGAFLGVNSGSGKKGAKLVVMEYKPKKLSKKEPILLVGKGLVFDSGGYNLKPSKSIEDMHQDKAGGSVVVGVFNALKDLDIKRHVVGIVPLTENLVDSEAQRPSDVVKSYCGKTIEIRNTDAEGRLILADALSYGVETFKPEYTIDFATLTGSCIVALGDRYAGVMGNNETLISKIKKSGDKTDELVWELPMHDDFREDMKGRVADLRNIDDGTSFYAGTSKAAAFLEYFVDGAKWAHIDIAGVAFSEKPKPTDQQFATGYGVRMMLDFLENC